VETPGRPADRRCPDTIRDPKASSPKINYRDGGSRLRRLVSEIAAQSPRFVELWESHGPDPRQDTSRRKTIDHPAVGRITLDCDVLIVAADDLRVMVYTAEPGTEDAESLALAVVLGTQELVD